MAIKAFVCFPRGKHVTVEIKNISEIFLELLWTRQNNKELLLLHSVSVLAELNQT